MLLPERKGFTGSDVLVTLKIQLQLSILVAFPAEKTILIINVIHFSEVYVYQLQIILQTANKLGMDTGLRDKMRQLLMPPVEVDGVRWCALTCKLLFCF